MLGSSSFTLTSARAFQLSRNRSARIGAYSLESTRWIDFKYKPERDDKPHAAAWGE